MDDKRQINRELRLVCRWLREHWDPIGVKDEPGCIDEYDSYAPEILGLLLRADTTVAELAAVLERIEAKSMGFPSGGRGPRVAAKKLIELWQAR